jgi:hypothetical protein
MALRKGIGHDWGLLPLRWFMAHHTRWPLKGMVPSLYTITTPHTASVRTWKYVAPMLLPCWSKDHRCRTRDRGLQGQPAEDHTAP